MFILAGDLARPERSLERLVQELRQVGAIGIECFDQTEHGRIESFDDLRKRLLVNGLLFVITAAFIVGRETAKRMIARGRGGKIVNIASLTSEMARATVAPYTAAKGGIKMLTRSMSAEWAKFNIQSNAIGPGYILTEMNTALIENAEFDAWVKASNPAGRWGKPEELVGTAVYLVSAASNYVNGQVIYVDGGWLSVL